MKNAPVLRLFGLASLMAGMGLAISGFSEPHVHWQEYVNGTLMGIGLALFAVGIFVRSEP